MQLEKSIRASTDARDLIPIALIIATAVVATVWKLNTGITFRAPLWLIASIGMIPLLASVVHMTVRPDREIAEATLFAGLYWIYGIFAEQLSYLGISLRYPLRDTALAKIDSAMGFDWRQWCEYANSIDWLRRVQEVAYGSFLWQAFLSFAIFAKLAPGRNRELISGLIIAATVTIAIGSLLPAVGAGAAYNGLQGPWPWESVIAALRSGSHEPLPYWGVITFPSLHSAGAVLLIIAHRGIKWTFVPFLLLNIVMLASTPWFGEHYLTDILAGIPVGLLSFFAARALLAAAEPFFVSAKTPDAFRAV